MKNIILITEDGEQLIASTDDGTNQLIINDTVIPSGDWVGTGTYTATIQGHNINIAKSPDLNGIIQIIRLSPYNYALKKAKQPWQQDKTTVTVDSGRETSLGTVNSNSYKDVSISFNKTFQSVPNVVACFESTAGSYGFGRLSLGVHSVTTTGFKVRVFNADTGGRSPYIQWIATV